MDKMTAVLLLLALSTVVHIGGSLHHFPDYTAKLEGQQFVDYINSAQKLFKARLPSKGQELVFMDSSYLQTPVSAGQTEEIDNAGDIPESFDAREKWSYCKSISLIRDQSKCGSCWAVSAASAMSDRLCIQTGGKNQTLISDSDILSCCNDWSPTCSRGCRGARDNLAAWEYVKERGSCSGGAYEEKGVCKPYPFYPCGPLLTTACPEEPFTAPECKKECQSGDKDEYERSRIYVQEAYRVVNDERAIQKEIMTNGPVQSGLDVYPSFRNYVEGIYEHFSFEQKVGSHAVKIIGWGVGKDPIYKKDVKYWLVASSHNEDWGEDGYFRIVRGTNECNIESYVVAGTMKV